VNASLALRLLLFLAGTVFFVAVSRQPLRNPRSHGFYRFFVFEGILVLLLTNAAHWFQDPFAFPQNLSLPLLMASLYLVLRAVALLKTHGGRRERAAHPENFAFENTVHLVTTGIYGRIRHPMYGSLLLLAWGLYLKGATPFTTCLVLATTSLVMVAVKVEERENIAFFGRRYEDYMARTKRFVPYLF